MRSTKSGFYLDPIQNPQNQNGGLRNDYDAQRLEFLEEDNERLKIELKRALDEVKSLREENLELKAQIKDPQAKIKALSHQQESTFVTRGSENPVIRCENCDNEIDRKNYDLHLVYCLKNLTKCVYCKAPIDLKEMQAHLDEKMGTPQDMIYAAQSGNLEALKLMQQHGGDLKSFQNDNDSNNSLLHYATKNNQTGIVNFLLLLQFISPSYALRGMNIDVQNKFGESSLHICSGQNKNLELSKLLIMQGANPNIKNNLGDSPLDLAKRYGNHEIVLLFSAQEQSSFSIDSGKNSVRRTRTNFYSGKQ